MLVTVNKPKLVQGYEVELEDKMIDISERMHFGSHLKKAKIKAENKF